MKKILINTVLKRTSVWCMVLSINLVVAAVSCPADMLSDTFNSSNTPSDYSSVVNNSPNQVNITGVVTQPTSDESYIQSKITTTKTDVTGGTLSLGANGAQAYIRYEHDPNSMNGNTVITYNFINKFDGQPQLLTNLSMTIYDLDTFDIGGSWIFESQDEVTIQGNNGAGFNINPTVVSSGGYVQGNSPTFYTQQAIASAPSCSNGSFDNRCRLAFNFSQPVSSVSITFSNARVRRSGWLYSNRDPSNPTQQDIEMVIDGYCYKPQPRMSLTKQMAEDRLQSSDQFTVQVKQGGNVVNDVTNATTTGSGSVVTNGTGTTGIFKIDPTKQYVLDEAAAGTTDLSQYAATYQCIDKNGDAVNIDKDNFTMTTYGTQWTCTVSNRRKISFSGIIFADNGGITGGNVNPRDVSNNYINNTNYFNGIYNAGVENGIYESGTTVSLTDCNGNQLKQTNVTASGTDIGRYTIEIPSNELVDGTGNTLSKVCLVENEPNGNFSSYPIDTTINKHEIILQNNQVNYLGNDFGEVIQDNAALVLIKEQVLNDCSITDFSGLTFSTNPLANVDPGQCIAYKITATNRGHLNLTNIVIQDVLQKKGVDGALVTSTYHQPVAISPTGLDADNSVALGQNGTVITKPFNLPFNPATEQTKYLIFNTKYGNQ